MISLLISLERISTTMQSTVEEITGENYLLFSSYVNNACSIQNIPSHYQGAINFERASKEDKVKIIQTIIHLLKDREQASKTITECHAHVKRSRQDHTSTKNKLKNALEKTSALEKEVQQYSLRADSAERRLRTEKNFLNQKIKALTQSNNDLLAQKRQMIAQKRKKDQEYNELQTKYLSKARGSPCIMTQIQPLFKGNEKRSIVGAVKKEEIQMLQVHIQNLTNQMDEIIEENTQLRQSYLNIECQLKSVLFEDVNKAQKALNPRKFEMPFSMVRTQIEKELQEDFRQIRSKMANACLKPRITEAGQDTVALEEKVKEQEFMLEDLQGIIERYIEEGDNG